MANCRNCIFSDDWKDWGPTDVYKNPVHAGWEGKCLINTNTVDKPLDISGERGVCRHFISWDWPEAIVAFVCGRGEGK